MQKKRLASFAPDFSMASQSVDRLSKSIQHIRDCEEKMKTPGFCLGQEIANKTLEIVMDEIYLKNTLRNYSALKAPAKGKMEM